MKTPDYGRYAVHPFADKFPLMADKDFADLVESIKKSGFDPGHKIVLNDAGSQLIDGRNRYLAACEAGVEPVSATLFELGVDDGNELAVADFIVRANLTRRHLSNNERAFLASVYIEMYAPAAAKAREEGRARGREAQAKQRESGLPSDDGRPVEAQAEQEKALPSDEGKAFEAKAEQESPLPSDDGKGVEPERNETVAVKVAKELGVSPSAVERATAIQKADAADPSLHLEEKVKKGELSMSKAAGIATSKKLPTSKRSIEKMERIEKLRPDLAAKIRLGELSMSKADTIISVEKNRPTQCQVVSSEAENAASELASIFQAYCESEEVPVETIISYLEESNAEQVIAILKYGDVKAALKRSLPNILRELQREFGLHKFQTSAISVIKEHTSPTLEGAAQKSEERKKLPADHWMNR